MTIKTIQEGMGLLYKKDKEVRTEKGLFEKPGSCQYECPYCGGIVYSCYFELDKSEYGETADYLHGGFICLDCRRSLRI